MTKSVFSFLTMLMATGAMAQTMQLSLDSCISLAIQNNKDVAIAQKNKEAAHYASKEAFTHYLPRVEAMGTFIHNSKDIQLISDEQVESLSNMGNTFAQSLQPTLQQMGALAQANPAMAPLVQGIGGMAQQAVPVMNAKGAELADALCPDTKNVTAAAIMLTQPIYMGGKIVAYNKITKYAEQIAEAQSSMKVQDLVVQVETIYWQIVSLESKRELAVGYKNLIDTLDYNVQQLIDGGLASKADGLSVKVKKNEADVTIIQIDNGLALSKMLLCQLCGLDVNADIKPIDDVNSAQIGDVKASKECIDYAMSNRPELQALGLLSKINDEKVKVTRAEYLPNVAFTGNYIWSNPSSFNGFENKFKGMWNVGVIVKIPLVNWGEGHYKIKSAKLKAETSMMTLHETQEKIELQTTQCVQRVTEASNREITAQRSMEEAEENLRFATLGMNEGVVPISNVLMAQTAWLSAKSTVLSARIDRRLAEVNLKRAMGVTR